MHPIYGPHFYQSQNEELKNLTMFSDRELCAITEPTCTTESQLLTFRSFSEHSVKNRVFTVGEVWLKQLSRIPKISQDKAEAIVQVCTILNFENHPSYNVEKIHGFQSHCFESEQRFLVSKSDTFC